MVGPYFKSNYLRRNEINKTCAVVDVFSGNVMKVSFFVEIELEKRKFSQKLYIIFPRFMTTAKLQIMLL